jgi:hypothetical protein
VPSVVVPSVAAPTLASAMRCAGPSIDVGRFTLDKSPESEGKSTHVSERGSCGERRRSTRRSPTVLLYDVDYSTVDQAHRT